MILDQIFEMVQVTNEGENLNHRLAQVIVNELLTERSFHLTVTELSKKANCSQPSVSRFAKALNLHSYKEFVRLLNEEAPNYFRMINLAEQPQNSIAANKKQILEAVQATLEKFQVSEIETIAKLIFRSQKVNVVGMGGNRTVKTEIEHKLSQVGKHAMLGSDWHQQLINLNYMTPDDLLIIISYSGDKKESNQIATEAMLRQIPILLFSGNFNSKLVQKATHFVCVEANDPKYRSFSFAAKPAVMAAWEIIFKQLLSLDAVSEEIVEA